MLLCILFVLNLIQSLLDIIEDVFYIFDTYRKANQIWRNTCFLQLLFAELAMGVTGWMEHTGAGIGYMGYYVDHVERIHKLDGCLAVSLQSEGNNTAGAVWHILLGKRMILIALQTAIMNPSHTLIVLQELCHYQTVISFNGLGFDIPYLKKKCEKYGLTHPFDEKDYIDIYKEVSGLKFLLKLPDYKQKTIERFLGLSRNDTFSGGELIEVYQNYLKTPDEQAMFFLKQHNYEDVLGMTGLIAIRSYRKLFDGAFTVNSTETNIYKDRNGIPQKELILTLQNQYPIPQRVSCQTDAFYLICDGMQSKLRIHLFEGTLKFFFDHPEDYYYLPAEDMAIHKSVATYVDKDFRKKATADNCYTKKDAIFVPQYETLITPFFKESSKDKLTYFELTREFLDSDSLLRQYTSHVFRHFLAAKH